MLIDTTIIEFLLPILVVVPICMAVILIIIKHNVLSYILTNLTTLFLLVFSVLVLFTLKDNNIYTYYFGNFLAPLGIEYKIDYLSGFFIVLISFSAFIVSIYNYKLTILEVGFNKYHLFNAVFMLNIAGFIGIVATNDAFNLFVFLEISSLTSYILISLYNTKKSYLAAFNYLIIGTISASLYVFGLGFLYSMFGTLNITTLALEIETAKLSFALIVAILMIFVGIIIKIAIFPLAFWLPATYKHSPFVASAFLSAVSSKVSIYMFIKFIIVMLNINKTINIDILLQLTAIISIVSVFIFGLWANKEDDLKILLAFSSLSQIGFIMVGISINTVSSITAALLILLSHSLLKLGLFLVVGNLQLQFGTTSLNKLKGVGHKTSLNFFTIIFFVLSLLAIPPSLMFFGKVYLIIATLSSQLYIYTILIMLGSIVSIIYGFKIIMHLWQPSFTKDLANTTNNTLIKCPIYMNISILILIIINIILIFIPNLVFKIINLIATNNMQI